MRQPRVINKNARKSAVWKYFDDFGDLVYVYCLLCAAGKKDTILSNAGGHTTALWEHIKTKQKSEWDEIKDKMRKLPQKSTTPENFQNKSHIPEGNIKDCMPEKETFTCILCENMFTSKLTLRKHNKNKHTNKNSVNVDIFTLYSFDQLDPSVRLLSGLDNKDKTSKKYWFDNLKTSIRESFAEQFESGPTGDDLFKTNWAMQKQNASKNEEEKLEKILESMVERRDDNWFCAMCGKQ